MPLHRVGGRDQHRHTGLLDQPFDRSIELAKEVRQRIKDSSRRSGLQADVDDMRESPNRYFDGETQRARSGGRLLRPVSAGDRAHAGTFQVAGGRVDQLESENDCELRCGRHRDRACKHKSPTVAQVVRLRCRYRERH